VNRKRDQGEDDLATWTCEDQMPLWTLTEDDVVKAETDPPETPQRAG
jgi:hypothetical protein